MDVATNSSSTNGNIGEKEREKEKEKERGEKGGVKRGEERGIGLMYNCRTR